MCGEIHGSDKAECEEQEGTKRCSKCKEVKSLSEFHKDSKSKDGLRYNCKPCSCEYQAKHRKSNRDAIRKYKAEYYKANRDAILAWQAEYYKSNRDAIRKYKAEHYESNREAKRKYNSEYYKSNRDAILAWQAKWQASNQDKRRAINHRRRARKANAQGSHTAADWKARLAYHGYRCIYCGVEKHETPQGWLTCEHLIPLSRGGSNWPSNLAPSCQSCNCSKGTRTHFEYLEYLNEKEV